MTAITNDTEFGQALARLSAVQQRVAGALFARNVLGLCDDERVRRALEVAARPVADADEIAAALRMAKAAALDAHARCGADGEWSDQAGYFVARAVEACLATQVLSEGRLPVWKAAMSSRMARTAVAEAVGEDPHDRESQHQYRILSDYLNSM